MLLTQDFVTPTLNFRPWLEKPPLLFWIEALSFRWFGVSEWSARLPVSVLSLLAALGCTLLLKRLHGLRIGLLALIILSSCPLFVIFSRAASTDAPLVACLTLALIWAFQGYLTGGIASAVAASIALGLAILAKGPVALLLGLSIIVGFSILKGKPLGSPAIAGGVPCIRCNNSSLVLVGMESQWRRLYFNLYSESPFSPLFHGYSPPLPAILVFFPCNNHWLFPLDNISGFFFVSNLEKTVLLAGRGKGATTLFMVVDGNSFPFFLPEHQ